MLVPVSSSKRQLAIRLIRNPAAHSTYVAARKASTTARAAPSSTWDATSTTPAGGGDEIERPGRHGRGGDGDRPTRRSREPPGWWVDRPSRGRHSVCRTKSRSFGDCAGDLGHPGPDPPPAIQIGRKCPISTWTPSPTRRNPARAPIPSRDTPPDRSVRADRDRDASFRPPVVERRDAPPNLSARISRRRAGGPGGRR